MGEHESRADICHEYHEYIYGEKMVMWRYFGKFWEIFEKFWESLGNFEKFWKILPQFTRFHMEKN